MEKYTVSTKYFGKLNLLDLPWDSYPLTLMLDGRETEITVEILMISVEALSEDDYVYFLAALDGIPRLYDRAKEAIRLAFSRRTMLTKKIKDGELRKFVEAIRNESSEKRELSCGGLLSGLIPYDVCYSQGPLGEFVCEMQFRFESVGGAVLEAEFQGDSEFCRFYFQTE